MKLSKIHLIILVLLAIILVLIFTKSNYSSIKSGSDDISQVCFQDNCFSVELAQTQEEKKIGLMNRESLDADKGMLFIYDNPTKASFWMKNTLIPLDIIWIDQDFDIVNIVTAQPCKSDPCTIYSPDQEASYILEIKVNLTKELNIKVGDKAEIKNL